MGIAPLLSLRNLCKEFRTGGLLAGRVIRAVEDVSIDVPAGETLGLVGESGCGKTTLARCALLLTEPTSGAVYFDGLDLASLPRTALRTKRREFQIILQDPFASLDPNMSVRQILHEPFEAHGLGARREREEWVQELAQAVSLDKAFLDRFPTSLSGGQQQRVGIARALALRPRLLVADEPVSALDASVQAQILNLLASLQRQFNLTLVLISHSLPVIHYLCSRVAVMYMGRIVEEASSEQFFAGPRHPYSELLLRSMPRLEGAVGKAEPGAADGSLPVALPPAGCAFQTRCSRVRERCRAEVPALREHSPGSKVACFLYTCDAASS
jgi:oligopeptide/dipeptide ABC transporter ATP-binding protein